MPDLRTLTVTALAQLFAAALFCGSLAAADSPLPGEAAFKEYCAECHADGGNIIKGDKTLRRVDRERNGVKTATDIVRLMRRPGEGMTTFDLQTIPEREAREIAEYVLGTFR